MNKGSNEKTLDGLIDVVADYISSNLMQVSTLIAQSITAQNETTVNETVTNSTITNASINNLILNSKVFKYLSGSFTPEFGFLEPDTINGGWYTLEQWGALNGATSTITYNKMTGYFERIGNICTVWYEIDISFLGQTYINSGRSGYPAMRNIPFKCTGPFNYTTTQFDVSNGSWPNGVAAGAPAPLAATYPTPYTAEVHTAGESLELIYYSWAGVAIVANSDGFHTMNGYEVPFYGNIEFYEVAAAVPPWALAANTYGGLTNIWIASSIGQPFHFHFEGQIEYYTTD